MTSVADFILIWEIALGAEMFPKCLLEQGRANLVTAFWYSSLIVTNFPIEPSTNMSKDVKIASMFLAAIPGFSKIFFFSNIFIGA